MEDKRRTSKELEHVPAMTSPTPPRVERRMQSPTMEAALQRKNTRGHISAGTPQRNARQMMIEVKETGVSIYIDHHVRVCRLGLLLVFHRVLLEGLCNNELEVL